MNRTIFPEMKLFKKEVTERFLIATREIFRKHPVYLFHNDDADTNIHIQPTYAVKEYKSKSPQLIVKTGKYDFALKDTLYQNMTEQTVNTEGTISGFASLKNMSTYITVIVRAHAEEESSNIADELAMLGVYAAHNMYTQVGVNIQGSSVSETSETNPATDTFDTFVNFTIDIPWKLETISGKGPIDPDIDIEYPEGLEGYHRPGVNVYQPDWDKENKN